MRASCRCRTRGAHGIDDVLVAGAPAEISGQALADLLVGRERIFLRADPSPVISMPGVQKPHCSAWCSRKASCSGESASGVPRLSTVSTGGAVGLHREHETGADAVTVHQDRARAADAVFAADMGAGEAELAGAGNP